MLALLRGQYKVQLPVRKTQQHRAFIPFFAYQSPHLSSNLMKFRLHFNTTYQIAEFNLGSFLCVSSVFCVSKPTPIKHLKKRAYASAKYILKLFFRLKAIPTKAFLRQVKRLFALHKVFCVKPAIHKVILCIANRYFPLHKIIHLILLYPIILLNNRRYLLYHFLFR